MEMNHSYQKKMTAYLDGTLPATERSEFEAYVETHPDFAQMFNKKKEEIEFLKSIIPEAKLSEESSDSLKSEINFSVKQLLSDEEEGMFSKFKSFFAR